MDEHGQEIEQTTLAPETEVALEVSQRLPLLLVAIGLAVGFIVCWRMMRRDQQEGAALLAEVRRRNQRSDTPRETAEPAPIPF